MRNRSSTSLRDENDFIHAGTAGIDQPKIHTTESQGATKANKAKPVSISFADENLQAIDRHIKNEIMSGNARANRSDVVRAGILALDMLSEAEVTQLIARVKLK